MKMEVTSKKTALKEELDELLNDGSFPSLVVLNGSWGSGKTFFLLNELIPAYETHDKPIYLSVVGLANRDDFINRLIATTIGLKGEKSGALATLVKGLKEASIKGSDKNTGAIMTLVSGISGIVKDTVLKSIKNKTFAIDDIERLEDKELKEQIIGECYLLAESNNNKFIFLTDIDKWELEGPVKEKYFSGIVNFTMTPKEIVSIIFCDIEFSAFQEQIKSKLILLELKNLRVLKRLSRRIVKIHGEVTLLNDVDVELTMKKVIDDSLTIAFMSSIHNKTASDIESLKSIYCLMEDDESGADTDILKKLDAMFRPSPLLIDFVTGSSHKFDNICEVVTIVLTNCPIDQFMNTVFVYMEENSFDLLFNKFEKFIFDSDDAPHKHWFEACEVYLLLIQWGYIDQCEVSFVEKVEARAKEMSFTIDRARPERFRTPQSSLTPLYEWLIVKVQSIAIEVWVSGFREKIMDNWLDAERYLANDQTPKLQLVSGKDWEAAIDIWTPKSIIEFAGFIGRRHGNVSDASFFKVEFDVIKTMKRHVSNKLEDRGTSFGIKRGHLFRLSMALKEAYLNLNGT